MPHTLETVVDGVKETTRCIQRVAVNARCRTRCSRSRSWRLPVPPAVEGAGDAMDCTRAITACVSAAARREYAA